MSNEELAVAAKAGDADALITLWESVRRVCFRIAGQYGDMLSRAGLDTDDIAQELFLAYHAALTAFDPEGVYRFTTYLTYHVKNGLMTVLGIRRGNRELPPDPLSLDEPLGETEDSDTRGSLVPDPDATQAFADAEDRVWCEQLHDALEQCLDTLEEKQAKAVRGTYFDNLTVTEVGQRLGVSTSRAAQLKQAGLRKLRQGKSLRRLREFRDEIDAGIYHGTSLSAWRYGGSSVEEQTILRLEELENPTSNFEPKT